MGPELGSKSAGRCSYHQRGCCTRAAIGNHFVHQLFYAFSGFMDRKQLGRYGCSGSTFTDTNQFAFVVTMCLFMSVGLAFATIISIGFQFFYTTVLKVIEQSIVIAIAMFFFYISPSKKRVHETYTQRIPRYQRIPQYSKRYIRSGKYVILSPSANIAHRNHAPGVAPSETLTQAEVSNESHKYTKRRAQQARKSTMADTDGSNAHSIDTPPPTAIAPRMYGPVMPCPGQPGALHFDNTNVTEFLRRWNIECEDFGLTDTQKCARIPDYSTPETKDVIELLNGYKTNDWVKLQS